MPSKKDEKTTKSGPDFKDQVREQVREVGYKDQVRDVEGVHVVARPAAVAANSFGAAAEPAADARLQDLDLRQDEEAKSPSLHDIGPRFKDQARETSDGCEREAAVTPHIREEVPQRRVGDQVLPLDDIVRRRNFERGSPTAPRTGDIEALDVSPSMMSMMRSPMVEAELVPIENSTDNSIAEAIQVKKVSRCKAYFIVVVLLLVVIAGVLGGVRKGSNKGGNGSVSPTMPLFVSECLNATPLVLGEIVRATIGMNTTVQSGFRTCGEAIDIGETAGVWFSFEAPNASGVQISTCTDEAEANGDYDSQMVVYTGSCDHLTCLDGNDNDNDDATPGCGEEAAVRFQAIKSSIYYILVFGRQPGIAGDFALQAKTAHVSPANNNCKNAYPLKNIQPMNATLWEADPPSFEIPACQDPYDMRPGVWFLYESGNAGIDSEATIVTCSPTKSFGRDITLYSGTCDSLMCDQVTIIEGDNDETFDCVGIINAIQFRPQSQTNYHILVQDFGRIATASPSWFGTAMPTPIEQVNDGTANFAIQVKTSKFELVQNDECENALPLLAGITVEGSYTSATSSSDSSLGLCAPVSYDDSAPDLWYKVQNSIGGALSVTSCTGNFSLDTSNFGYQFLVYEGDCNNLVCVNGDFNSGSQDGYCGLKASVTWQAQNNATYFLRVLGYQSESPEVFGIKLDLLDAPSNDLCSDAVSLSVGEIKRSTTIGATVDARASCSFPTPSSTNTTGVWFKFVGDGANYTASTCTGNQDPVAGTTFDSKIYFYSQIHIYSGDCGNLTCTAFNEDNNTNQTCNTGATWFAERNETYWIRIFGFDSFGSFSIVVNPTPSNDFCQSATMLEINQTLEGTTLGATAGSEQSVCGRAHPAEGIPEVWYTIIGMGGDLTVTTCTSDPGLNSFGFYNQMVVYAGGCESLICIDGSNEDDLHVCYGSSGVSWFANAGELYYVKIYGLSSFDTSVYPWSPTGSFGITAFNGEPTISETPVPANDLCEDAHLLVSGNAVIGTTIGATPGTEPVCGDVVPPANGFYQDVWYQFVGTGENHTVTTCTGLSHFDFGFDSQVVIYSGVCGNLTCITGNDDSFGANNTCPTTAATASWATKVGVVYFIRIFDFYGEQGVFRMKVNDGTLGRVLPVPDNDECQNAAVLMLGERMEGTTNGATARSESRNSCGYTTFIKGSPDVWYTLVGTGDFLTVTTCTGSPLDYGGFDSQIEIFTGDCSSRFSLSCITGNDNDLRPACYIASLAGVSWQSEAEVTYFIRVSSPGSAFGSFGIKAFIGEP